MKQLTEAQVMGFRGSMPPRTQHRYSVNVEPGPFEHQAARRHTTTRRAIEEHHERRQLHQQWEL